MTASEPIGTASQVKEYLAFWERNFSEVVTTLSGTQVAGELLDSNARVSPEGVGPVEEGFWVQVLAGKTCQQVFNLKVPDALYLASLVGKKPAEPAESLPPDIREVVVDFFQQIANRISPEQWPGFQEKLTASEGSPPEWAPAASSLFRFSSPQGPLFALETMLSEEFRRTLALEVAPAPSQFKEPSKRDASSASRRPSTIPGPNLDLLMDIELEAVIRMGQREMLLKDVLTLSPGSVIEFEQDLHDPVELIVGRRVIAWGEVVAVDGNYGLRVTGVASREERLESLRK